MIISKEKEAMIGVVVDRLEADLGMEIDQIPPFARMIDGRSRTSVRIMVANGRRTEAETQEVYNERMK